MEHNIVHNECNMKLIVGGEGSVRIPSLIDQISKRSKGAIFFLLFAICTTFRSYWPFLPNIPNIQKNQRVLFAIDHYLSILWIRANDHHLIKLTTYPKIQISWHLSPYLSAFTLPTREIITGITWSMIILRTSNASRRANTNSHLLVISRRPSDHIEDKEFFSAPVPFRAGPTQSNSYEFSSSQYFCPGASSKF